MVLSAETWFDNEMAPNMGSAADMLDWLQESVLPNVTGVVSSVSAILISLLYLLKDLLIAVIASVYLLMR